MSRTWLKLPGVECGLAVRLAGIARVREEDKGTGMGQGGQ